GGSPLVTAGLHRALGRLGSLTRVVNAHDALSWRLTVVDRGVEAHLVPVRVVQLGQDPPDRREVHPGVRLAERGGPGGELLDRLLRRDADGEVVESCRGLGACRVEAQRELWAAIGVAHPDTHQLALFCELHYRPVTEAGFVPGARPGEVADRQLHVMDAV